MALPARGGWVVRDTLRPYDTALVWGTGIDPVHEQHGEGPPLRTTGRQGYHPDTVPAYESVPEYMEMESHWGYRTPTGAYTGVTEVYLDSRPRWGDDTSEERTRQDTEGQPSWDAPQSVNERFRGFMGGAHRLAQKLVNSIPQETVSEGWRNKPKGNPANSITSDPEQYERQTSMQQRYARRNNEHAVERGTDESRAGIASRVRGQRLKIYSGGERHYDMYPFQQETMLRPFYYRTFGTGNPADMSPNEMTLRSPVRRVPPGDPSMGPDETDLQSNDFGYTPEDAFYA